MRKFLFCLIIISVFVGMVAGAMYVDSKAGTNNATKENVKFQQAHKNLCYNGFNNQSSCASA